MLWCTFLTPSHDETAPRRRDAARVANAPGGRKGISYPTGRSVDYKAEKMELGEDSKTIFELMHEHNVIGVDLLKLDCEGMDCSTLRSLMEVWRWFGPVSKG